MYRGIIKKLQISHNKEVKTLKKDMWKLSEEISRAHEGKKAALLKQAQRQTEIRIKAVNDAVKVEKRELFRCQEASILDAVIYEERIKERDMEVKHLQRHLKIVQDSHQALWEAQFGNPIQIQDQLLADVDDILQADINTDHQALLEAQFANDNEIAELQDLDHILQANMNTDPDVNALINILDVDMNIEEE